MKISLLRERIIAAARERGYSDEVQISLIVDLTLAGVDLHVDREGEIYSPAPEQRFMPPGMEAKWGGGSRRRRGGR